MYRKTGSKQKKSSKEIVEDFRVVSTVGGLRLLQSGDVLSEMRDKPAPTDDLFDVLAALMACVAPGPLLLMLGFAGGGVIAPLRAMGYADPIEAVDLSRKGEILFRRISKSWAGEVRVHQADAVKWLASRRKKYDCIVEDLSIPSSDGSIKPDSSLELLPRLIAKRLSPRGMAIINVLPFPEMPWTKTLETLARPFREALTIRLVECENRILLCGRRLPTARLLSSELRRALRSIESNQAAELSVATLKRSTERRASIS